MASADLRDELNCSICLNIYTDPVTLTCGHNFCLLCIGNVLDTQQESGIYTCPECRAESQYRPALQRNTTLCNIVERLQSAQPVQPVKEVTGIPCTYCLHASVPAAKTCLHCEASVCGNHLKVHSKSAEHILIEPTNSPRNRKCSVHNEILKYYCTEDCTCICVSCSLAGSHKGHHFDTLNYANKKKKEKLIQILAELNLQQENAEKRNQYLQKHMAIVKEKAAGLRKQVTKEIKDIKEHLELLEKIVLNEISRQEDLILIDCSHLMQKQEKRMNELAKKISHTTELLKTPDPLNILQEKQSLRNGFCDAPKKEGEKDLDIPGIAHVFQMNLAVLIQDLKKRHNIIMVSKTLLDVKITTDIFLDENTASNLVSVSKCLQSTYAVCYSQSRPDTPMRFQFYPQVLSNRVITFGRHYWEVETSKDGWIIGMAYPSIDRKGRLSYDHSYTGKIESFVGDCKSWRLRAYRNNYSVLSDRMVSTLNCRPSSQRLGIYLDYKLGLLSFYEMGNSITHLHTFNATFTEPLLATISVWDQGRVRIIGSINDLYICQV
ncbi:tripartite motif-containing 7-like [Pelobates cultripes]|uniref:Tripartite motif-containing 7-like n=1 Tax=Pelobates cultripes TaxID=61616 RepID=A0AAD1TNY4_PELCU|nr:tripartite motif-containing 7-like [Pelobates cultripes]